MYAVDLEETEFLHLKPIIPIEELGVRPAEFRLNAGADKILERYEINNLHYLAVVSPAGIRYHPDLCRLEKDWSPFSGLKSSKSSKRR